MMGLLSLLGDLEIGRNDSKNPPKLQVAKAIHQRRKGAK